MKSTFFVLIAVSCYFGAANSKANAQNIISELETSKEGEGTIHIVCDPKITELLGTPAVISNPDESIPAQGNENPAARAIGYRIQIYMDNSQKAKNEVIRIESLFNETFPDVWTYVTYNAPNWKVLAGDFRTREEAAAFQQTIQHFLPELGKEMYVVPSKINLSIQR
ncbi:MAG: SPOR domain-containing protein [Dysgonamonadaceae bacterium]|jgi:hypothetical protein|nr:SPOR domain-containing protein [Dysgonamonadaceae bacterium]